MARRIRKTPWSRTGCSDGQKPRCQTCLRLGLECVQFDIFCPINVVTPTRDTRSSRSASDADAEPDADESNHSSPASTSSGSSGGSTEDAESSSGRELVPMKARRLSRSSTQSQPELQFQTQFQLVHPGRRRRGNRENQDRQAVALRARGGSREIPSLSEFSYLSTSEYFYLQYYLERLSNVLVNANSRVNPLKSLILPRISSSSLLLDAICATAAVHRSSASEVDRSEYATMATRYYVRVLSAVRELIPRVSSSKSGSGSGSGRAMDLITDGNEASPVDDGSDIGEDDAASSSGKGKGKGKAKNNRSKAIEDKDTAEMAILASIFLCKYEIIKDGVENWRLHLRGIESLCQSLDADQAASMSETLTYVRSFMSYHKNIARITETSPQEADEFEHEPFEQDRLFPVDPYMGFSQSLIILLGRVNDLLAINVQHEPEKLEQGIRELLRLLALRSWDAHRFAIPEGMKPSTIENSSHIAEAYRCAVIACVHAALELLAEREPRERGGVVSSRPVQAQMQAQLEAQHRAQFLAQAQHKMPINWGYLHALLPMTKADALTECLAAVARVPLGCPEEAGLLPLLFIVACETNRPEQAREALQRVEALGSHIGLGNVRCASALLNQVWKRRSEKGNFSDWRGLLADANWDLIIT
ncbi:hypothetical protein M419DRAFT_75762 [Trichoderma reesei RUT C-30]|uniref:Zn(2)-C6 fungal-type domain-containing protein n=1 Tax=Hypocrea jecorina (strain ATCC 56765 / BCRC 32924 / NRRL 11460 / Rut C-30) TaxID=1344414 RepID=A0A024SDZ5_HYPJR|nr:hypothetical protein M419DRAFT_75762 [Trichoderma reesei RUT C-30]